MKLTHSESGDMQEKAAARPKSSAFKRYMVIGAAAFGIGAMAMPSCGSNNTDSVINLPPISSDGGVDGTVSDGGQGPADAGNCILPPGACSQQVVQNQTLNLGDAVVIGGYRFMLMGTGETDGNQFAVFGILDACGNPMSNSNVQIAKGQTQNIHIDGTNEDIALSVPGITVLSPQTATISATVTCGGALDAGTTDGGVQDGGAGGSDGGSGGSDAGAGGMDSGTGGLDSGTGSSDGGSGGMDAGSGGMDSGVSDGGAGGLDSGVSDAGAGGMDAGLSDGGSGGLDSGVSDAGAGGMDSGVSDGGSGTVDAGVADGGSDAGTCAVATTGSYSGFISTVFSPTVGGYKIAFDSLSGSDVLVDVKLGSCSIQSGYHCPTGTTTNIDDPANGKQIQIHVFSATASYATVSISVVNH